jgi:hypothetical protein
MTKLDDLKLLHKNLNQMGNQLQGLMTQASTVFPDDAVSINKQLETAGGALEEARSTVRQLAGVETMKTGGTTP